MKYLSTNMICTVLAMLLGAVSVESFLVPRSATASVSSRTSSTQRWVLADPPSTGSNEEEKMVWEEEDEFTFGENDDEEEEQAVSLSSLSASAGEGQPIRRLRRDKREPLIAVVGRPNVVRRFRTCVCYVVIACHATQHLGVKLPTKGSSL